MKLSFGDRVFEISNYIILCIICIVTVYPFYYVVMASLSDGVSLMSHRGLLLTPLDFSLGAYSAVLRNPAILIGYKNTFFVVIVGVAVNLFLTSLGAFFLSRRNVFWKKPIMLMIIFTMFFKGGLIPFYLTVKGVHLDNSLFSVIIPFAIDTFNLIIMTTSFKAIPYSLEEAAKMDGATDYTVFFRVVLPMSIPIIMVMLLYYGVSRWNGWFYFMLFVRQKELYPLQLVLREILIQNDNNMVGSQDQMQTAESIKYATIIVATVPILLVYPFIQKYFVKGVMIGAVKE